MNQNLENYNSRFEGIKSQIEHNEELIKQVLELQVQLTHDKEKLQNLTDKKLLAERRKKKLEIITTTEKDLEQIKKTFDEFTNKRNEEDNQCFEGFILNRSISR